jgi:DNA-binding CsgD family transcriptional regulator
MKMAGASEQQVFQSVKRACYAGLGSVTLRTELARRIARLIPVDANNFATTDPDTWLINHAVGTAVPADLSQAFLGRLYPDDEAISSIEQARARRLVEPGSGGDLLSAIRSAGFEQDLRALYFNTEALWGSWCLLRARGSSPFTDREIRFMERVAPHVTEALKSAAFMDLAAESAAEAEGKTTADGGPGYLILDPSGRVTLRTPAAAGCLADLGSDCDAREELLPFAVHSVRGRLLRGMRFDDAGSASARVRARGRSGTWYALGATLCEPDALGGSSTVVSVAPLQKRDVAPLFFRLYGLSPREREVVVWIIRGEPTKRIANHMSLSAHTVQDYLDKACEKIGVRGRKALVARLFRDGFAPGFVA